MRVETASGPRSEKGNRKDCHRTPPASLRNLPEGARCAVVIIGPQRIIAAMLLFRILQLSLVLPLGSRAFFHL